MPYILQSDRAILDAELVEIATYLKKHSNEDFRVVLFRMLNSLIKGSINGGLVQEKPSYAQHNAMIGMLQCCRLEWFRKQVEPNSEFNTKANLYSWRPVSMYNNYSLEIDIPSTTRLQLKLRSFKDLQLAGALNYSITKILLEFTRDNRNTSDNHRIILETLEAVQKEWYSRETAPYEDEKILENGDV